MSFTDVLAELAVYLRLDSSSFVTDSGKAVAAGKRLEGGMAGLPKRLGGVANALGGLAGTFAGGLLVGGVAELGSKLVELGKGAIENAASLHVASQQLGVTTDDLQRYRFAAGQVGLEQDKVDLGLKRLNKSIGLADRGLGPGAKAFAAMGISVRDSSGHLKTVGQILPEVAGYIAKLPDPAARAALEFQLFGRSGQDMAPLLNIGAQGVNNLTAAADKAGAVISPELIERAHKLEVGFTRLKTIIETKVEIGLLTAVEKASSGFDSVAARVAEFDDKLIKLQSDADAWDRSHGIPTKSEFLGQFATEPLEAFDKVLLNIQAHADEFDRKLGIPAPKQFFDGLLAGITENDPAIDALVTKVDHFLGDMASKIPGMVADFERGWGRIIDATSNMVTSVENWLKTRLGGAMDWVSTKAHQVGDAFSKLYDRVVGHSYVPDMVQGIAGEFARLKEIMVDPTLSATDKVSAAFQGLANVAGQVFGSKAGGIFGAIASAVSAIAPLFGGHNFGSAALLNTPAPVSSGLLNALPIAPRAMGGPVVPGRMYHVGENGPEYVSFGSRGFVHPNKGGNDNGLRIQVVKGDLFDVIVDRRAGNVAAPMAGRAAMTGAAGGFAAVRRRAERTFP